jgi:type IV secretion system protein VirB10
MRISHREKDWTEEFRMTHHNFVLWILALLPLTASAASPETSQEAAQEAQIESQMIVPEGTVIPIVLTAYLNTRSTETGDKVYAETVYPIWIQQRLVIPKGSAIRGTVTDVVRPGKIKGKGRLSIRFDDILLPNGVKRDLVASLRSIHGPGDENLDRQSESVSAGGSQSVDAGTIVGTTSQGAIIGAVAGRGSGAAIGAGAGAAAGIVMTLFTRGRDMVLSPGTHFDLELQKPIKFAYSEIEFTHAQLDSSRRTIQPRPAQAAPRENPLGGRRLWPFGGIGTPVY